MRQTTTPCKLLAVFCRRRICGERTNLKLAQQPCLLHEGATPRLLDEWQPAPNLLDAVRFEAEQRNAFNQFTLTGSAVPIGDMTKSHSGTGRIARMTMRPMSLFESRDSNGDISL